MSLLTLTAALLAALALLGYLGGIVYVLTRAADAQRFDYEWINVLWSALFDPEPTNPVPPQWRL